MNNFLASLHFVIAGLVFILGLVLLRENPRGRLNRIVASMLLFVGLGATLGSSDFLIPQVDPKRATRVDLVRDFGYLWEFYFPTLLLFAMSYPTPWRGFARRGAVIFALFLPHVAHAILLAANAALGDTFGIPTESRQSVAWAVPRAIVPLAYGLHQQLFAWVNLIYAVSAVGVIMDRARREVAGLHREQLRVLGWGTSIAAGFFLVSILYADDGATDADAGLLPAAARLLSLLAGSGTIAFAMVRYRFLDATLIARRAILYAISTAVIVGVYLFLVVRLDQLVQRATGIDTPVFQALILVVALVLYQPLLAKTEELLEGVLLAERTDYRSALRSLSEQIVTRLDSTELGQLVVTALRECLLTDRLALVRLDDSSGAQVAVSEGLPIANADLASEMPDESTIRDAEPLSPIVTSAGTLFLLPLRDGDRVRGALVLGPKVTGSRYTREDQVLLSTIANQVSVALHNAELHEQAMARVGLERDLENARRIQESFLPATFPQRGDVDIFGENVPSREVGGDYYDVVECGDDTVIVAVADVSGKGIPAALLASMLQASLRTQVSSESSPGRIVDRLNRLVCAGTADDQFATLLVGRYDIAQRRFTFANAGHEFPIVVNRSREARSIQHSDLILGVSPAVEYREISVDLCEGDRIMLFTDGISEATLRGSRAGERMLGADGLIELFRSVSPDETALSQIGSLRRRIERVVDAELEADDMTLLLLRVPASETVSQEVASPPLS